MMDKTGCVFCKFSKNPTIKIWENKLFYAMYDSFPVSPGHAIIISKRHVVAFEDLTDEEWKDLKLAVNKILIINRTTDFKRIYRDMLEEATSENSIWFLKKTLDNPNISKTPDAHNYGVNDGTSSGRTVDHFHWHIIPRYKGDVDDPRGGVRYVIPDLGNYKIPRK